MREKDNSLGIMLLGSDRGGATYIPTPNQWRSGLVHEGEHEFKRRQHNSEDEHNQQSRDHGLKRCGKILQDEEFPNELKKR